MEACYDGKLVMPCDYVTMDTEEMTYVDGGMYLNAKDTRALAACIGATAAMNAGAICALVKTAGAGGVAALFGGIPVIGWVIAAFGVAIILKSAWSFSSALCEALLYRTGMNIKIGFNWFVPYLKCSADN